MVWAEEGVGNGTFAFRVPMYHLVNPTSKRIFILEGILTVVISLIAYFIVPTWSHKAKFVRVLLLFQYLKTSTLAAI
jgi:hypothetical protein